MRQAHLTWARAYEMPAVRLSAARATTGPNPLNYGVTMSTFSAETGVGGGTHQDGTVPRLVPPPTADSAALELLGRFGSAGWRLLNRGPGDWQCFRDTQCGRQAITASTITALYAKLAALPDAPPASPGDAVASWLEWAEWFTSSGVNR